MEKVTILVKDKTFEVDREKLQESDYYGGMIQSLMSMTSITQILAPGSVDEIAVDHYVRWLGKEPLDKKQLLKSYFQHCSIIGHDRYFLHCVKKLLKHYSEYSDILDDLNSNIKREIFLNSPLNLIPIDLVDDEIFIYAWIENIYNHYNNKQFTVDLKEGLFHRISYYDNGQPKLLESFDSDNGYNSRKEGLQISFHENGKRHLQKSYSGDRAFGIMREWDQNGTLISQCSSVGDTYYGEYNTWYPSGRKKRCIEFSDDKIKQITRWLDEVNPDGSQKIEYHNTTYLYRCFYNGRIVYVEDYNYIGHRENLMVDVKNGTIHYDGSIKSL